MVSMKKRRMGVRSFQGRLQLAPMALGASTSSPNSASSAGLNGKKRNPADSTRSRAEVPVYREQIRAADVVVLTAPDGTTAEERDAARAALDDIISAGARVSEDARKVDLTLLDGRHR